MSKEDIKKVIKEAHAKGEDIPKELLDVLKKTQLGQEIDLENKMSLREK